ncbi:hypothetical protein B0T24DRAFT_174615 [Lasiosphaeria ovina]|uniref:DEAD-box RNA helicase Q domain-containing protein n=1 Tax=Lasiosphaeria ovina TaxID=92902 RepID=A0AAE0NE70_9PEZI|nr:hypothetical protein B0T24DRAFT_174615 [Lasiosphaeria ovina]
MSDAPENDDSGLLGGSQGCSRIEGIPNPNAREGAKERKAGVCICRGGVKEGQFCKIASIELYQEGPVRVKPISKFEDAGLHPVMVRNVKLSGYKVLTPIQRYCIPVINMGHDVIAVAQTGTLKLGDLIL